MNLLLLSFILSRIPAFLAATISAPSVGSPTTLQPPLALSMAELLACTPILRILARSSSVGSSFAPWDMNWPDGSYPAPVTSIFL